MNTCRYTCFIRLYLSRLESYYKTQRSLGVACFRLNFLSNDNVLHNEWIFISVLDVIWSVTWKGETGMHYLFNTKLHKKAGIVITSFTNNYVCTYLVWNSEDKQDLQSVSDSIDVAGPTRYTPSQSGCGWLRFGVRNSSVNQDYLNPHGYLSGHLVSLVSTALE